LLLIHAQALRCLHLSARNRLDARAHDLADVRRRVECERDHTREECAIVLPQFAGDVTRQQQAVSGVNQHWHEGEMHEQNLHEEWCAAKEAHIGQAEPAQQLFPAVLLLGRDEPDQ